jgi:endonuclease/exonuclease/phosphatase family metal-dependent hydrolase
MKRHVLLLAINLAVFAGTSAQELSILTYNLRYDTESDGENQWSNRKDFLVSQLNFYQPDVFGTQEGLLHQLHDIREGLADYKFIGKGRDQGGDEGEFSAIFYNLYTLNLLSENTFWLSETPEVPSKGWDAAIKRVCTHALFETRSDGKKFYVFNTHLDHMGEEARKQSVLLLLRKISEINSTGLPVVLMGDFNLEPDHGSIVKLSAEMEDVHLTAGPSVFGPKGTFNEFDVSLPATRRIDYLFLSPQDFKVLRYAILTATREGRFPSDHFPVYAELKFN